MNFRWEIYSVDLGLILALSFMLFHEEIVFPRFHSKISYKSNF
jgi:hypothetical protein